MKKQQLVIKACLRCTCTIETVPNGLYCKPCKKIVKDEKSADSRIRCAAAKRIGKRDVVVNYTPGQHKSSVTDAQQMKINQAIDRKHASPCALNHPARDSAEFNRLAMLVTPRCNVRCGYSQDRTLIYPEGAMARSGRRESSISI